MKWYYSKDGQQAGPVDEAEFSRLVAQGVIRNDTLVWKEGMPQWQPYSAVAPGAAPFAPSTPPISPSPTGSSTSFCSVCSKPVTPEDSILIGGKLVCSTCKPAYVQAMQEGSGFAGDAPTRYAGFWIRVAAYIVDQLILGAVFFPIAFLLGIGGFTVAPQNMNNPNEVMRLVAVQGLMQIVQWILIVGYYTFFTYKYAATPGKMLCRIRIIRADNTPLSLGLCVGRAFAHILSGLICGIGYFMAAFDDQKRGLHDRICNTRVVYRD